MKKLVLAHERFFTRIFEVAPGLVIWIIITAPIWGGFWIPHYIAYFVILFDIFWLFNSFTTAIFGAICYPKLKKEMALNWKSKAQNLTRSLGFIHHIVIIPNYREKFEKLDRALQSLLRQDIGAKNLTIVLAMEKREDLEAEIKANTLKKKYTGKFANLLITYHPLLTGEVAGKSSNEAYAAKIAKEKLVDGQGLAIENFTITSTDADAVFHPKYFSALAVKFAEDPNRYEKFWQPLTLHYNNFWQLPFPVRMATTISNISALADFEDPTRQLFVYSTYSASLKMVTDVGYWDTDVIPEDWHMFLKCFYALGGRVIVESVRIPVYFDAVYAGTFIKTLITRYQQNRRHAWGLVDFPYAVKQFFLHPEIPVMTKLSRITTIARTHFIWSSHWFILTLGATVPVLINPVFAQTVAGHNLPTLSRVILTTCLVALAVIVIIDIKLRPAKPANLAKWVTPFSFLQWLLLPVTSLFLASLPGLDAHTRLMFGKRLEYQVTEKA